jgi:PAS domain S-box-containing protein
MPKEYNMPFVSRWRKAWHESLRFRLLALGLTPLLVAFPFVIAVLVVVGGERADSLLTSNLRSNLAGTRNYLNQLKTETGVRVGQMVQSERLVQLLHKTPDSAEFNQVLATAAKGSGLDFLIVATPDGSIIGASIGGGQNARLPDSYVIRQARIGIANAAFERIDNEQLAAISPQLSSRARVDHVRHTFSEPSAETRGLLINAAAHFPLVANNTDAILVGGIMLNNNFALIDHMRDIIYPVGSLPGDAEGRSGIYLDDVSVTASYQQQQGKNGTGISVDRNIVEQVVGRGETWIGKRQFDGLSYIAGYEPIMDGDGQRIGMIGAGFPDAPYYNALWILQGMVAALLALTMLALSVVFLRAGRQLTQRLASIAQTMTQVSQGNRAARVGTPLQEDELGRLSRHFDVLLDTIAQQDAVQRATLKTVADEASRRRALFEHERDGVVILNQDGSVFEANPKCAAMLGYSNEEFMRLRMADWDTRFQPTELDAILNSVGPEGKFFETEHRRKDGTTYAAEISISRAQWSDQTFVLVLQRNIANRKAVEAELEKYRLDLEARVEERTRELNVRSEQLNAIFTLSPDGFVSFDRHFEVSFVNRAFLRMSGLEEGEIMGLNEQAFSEKLANACLENATFPGIAALRAARQKVAGISGGKAGALPVVRRRQLIELASPNGRVLEVGIRLSETENVSQILYFRDVTHETEVDRMKSEFLSTAAHELRTPMASIYGYSEVLLTQTFDEEMQHDLLNTIFRQSQLMSSIINELLDLARIEARRGKDFVIEKLSLAEVVGETVEGFKAPTGRALPLISAPEKPLLIKADRKKMQQAVLNILSNAYKYSPNGEPVTINLQQRDNGEGRQVGVEICDRGIGMTTEEQSRVFERFYRADTSGKIPGTGLGMSIVKEIAELHGGSVEVASQPGAGTRVTLWIPAM